MMTTTARYEPHDTTRHATARNGTERNGTAYIHESWSTTTPRALDGPPSEQPRFCDSPFVSRTPARSGACTPPTTTTTNHPAGPSPPALPPPYNPQARRLPLERGSSLGWDQYERANAGNSRAGPSPPSTMDTHRRASFPRARLPLGILPPPRSPFSPSLFLFLLAQLTVLCPPPARPPPCRSRFLPPPLCFPWCS